MAKEKPPIEGDDGRTVAPMNVDGMPWYQKNRPETPASSGQQKQEKFTWGERRALLSGVLKACLLITVSIWGVYALFILMIYIFGK